MPTIQVYRHGTAAGTPPGANHHPRAPRRACQGWTPRSSRANTRFLWSIDETQLHGVGISFTLTLRRCPETAADWRRLVDLFLRQLEYLGAIRIHQNTEWQARGVPHLHGSVWFPEFIPPDLVERWLKLAAAYGPLPVGQDVAPLRDALSWFQYCAKHASRGCRHYQRSPENIPAGWTSTGRVWGRRGHWPLSSPEKIRVNFDVYHRFRRLVRSYLVANARSCRIVTAKVARGIRSTRRILKWPDHHGSAVRGLGVDIPESVAASLLEFARRTAYG